MKALADLFALTLSITHTAELEVRIAAVEHSSAEVRDDPELAGKLQALVESATVHSTAWAAAIPMHRA